MSKQKLKPSFSLVTLVMLMLALGACAKAGNAPAATQASSGSSAHGVTARQVQQLIAHAFNTPDRDLALWAIQPGLGTVMREYGARMATAYLAAQQGDWGLRSTNSRRRPRSKRWAKPPAPSTPTSSNISSARIWIR